MKPETVAIVGADMAMVVSRGSKGGGGEQPLKRQEEQGRGQEYGRADDGIARVTLWPRSADGQANNPIHDIQGRGALEGMDERVGPAVPQPRA